MVTGDKWSIPVASQSMATDQNGYRVWEREARQLAFDPAKTAMIITDAWDTHWSRGVVERSAPIVVRINELANHLRKLGVLIVHTPSDAADFYAGTPARQRLLDAPPIEAPPEAAYTFPPLPIDDADGGSETTEDNGVVNEKLWTRQHEAIEIDHRKDAIAGDEGREIYSLFVHKGIKTVFYVGFSTNMCVLHRSFGIKQMLRWGLCPILIRDMTDSTYNPASRPYVSHEEGTQLVVAYIEKFVCPTVSSRDLYLIK